MDLETIRRRMQQLQEQATNETARAGGFGGELEEALRNRTTAFEAENNDVNTKRNELYNSFGLFDGGEGKQYNDDPSLYFQNLARHRVRQGTNLANSEDIRSQKQGTINDFIRNLTNAAQVQAQRTQGQLAGEQQNFNNAMSMEQMRQSNASRGQSQVDTTGQNTAAVLQQAQQQAQQQYQQQYFVNNQWVKGYEPGSSNYMMNMNKLIKTNLEMLKPTLPSTGFDTGKIHAYMGSLVPKLSPQESAIQAKRKSEYDVNKAFLDNYNKNKK
jgi:hypothetical protein